MLTEFVSDFLVNAGYDTQVANTATDGIACLKRQAFDMIVLDLSLPDEDGLVLLRKWQHSKNLPVLVISSRADDETRIVVLELGAADYIAKPFHPKEFLLRIKRLLPAGQAPGANSRSSLRVLQDSPYLAIDLSSRQIITHAGIDIALTRAEFDILACLATQDGAVLDRHRLTDVISYHDKEANPNSLGVLIHRLRKKLSAITGEHELIMTVPNVGYRLNIRKA